VHIRTTVAVAFRTTSEVFGLFAVTGIGNVGVEGPPVVTIINGTYMTWTFRCSGIGGVGDLARFMFVENVSAVSTNKVFIGKKLANLKLANRKKNLKRFLFIISVNF
jgi:hypothetical protein